ncbi:MAG: TolC family protein [Leptospiraceae bacterium]|nr:TolC family protein [Leptospiraceae bacterium]MCP5495937.1 TolC family protein [Leptospiraceae bacterium]
MKKYFLFFLVFTSIGMASEDFPHNNPKCSGKLKLQSIVECVLEHSPIYKKSKLELKAIQGKKIAAGYLFPSNPVLSVSHAYRRQTAADQTLLNPVLQSSINGELMLTQEIYIGGQRRGMLDVVDAEFAAQVRRVTVMERELISQALKSSLLFKDSIEKYKLILDLYSLSQDLYKITKGRADKGLVASIDADIAKSESIKIYRLLQIAEREKQINKANLTIMMGVKYNSPLAIQDALPKLSIDTKDADSLIELGLQIRGEVIGAEYDIIAAEKRIQLLRKERIPNLSFSGYVQRDGFNENVIGAKLAMPLKFFRDNSGEILEGIAKKEQKLADQIESKHNVMFEVIQATTNYNSLKIELENYSPELMGRINEDLHSIRKAILSGQMNIRDALLTQQSLISLKLSYIQSKLEYYLSIVEVLRASGLPFPIG